MGKLVWLASYPKSGNTWLRLLLHNFILQPGQPFDINALHLFSTSEDMAGHFRRHDTRPPKQYTIADVQRMRPLVHRDLRDSRDGIVFVKTHNAFVFVQDTPLITPQFTSGAIYIVRDPRDVAVSYSQHFGIAIDQAIDILQSPTAMTGGTETRVFGWPGSWSVNVESWTATRNPKVLVLRYEDLLADTAGTFAEVIRFFGLPIPEQRLQRAVEFSSFEVAQAQERRDGFVEHPAIRSTFFREGRSGGWRDRLTSAQAGRIIDQHGTQMERFGFL